MPAAEREMEEGGLEPWLAAPEALVQRFYALLSGPAELERPWDEVAALFWPGARLRIVQPQPDGSEAVSDLTPAEFAEAAAPRYRMAGLWEREVARRVEQYGNIAHVWSTYEAWVHSPDSAPVTRGINSVQLARRAGAWRIASLVWYVEHPEVPIPGRYL
jgi:hypothetical protein